MLLQFSVKNFKSFKEEAVLTMEASSDASLPENLTETDSTRFLNTAVIFGANGAGKSSLLSAIRAAVILIRHSNTRQVSDPLLEIVSFRFDPETVTEASSFEFVFLARGMKYVHGFSATRKEIQDEYLYAYHSSKASTIFERSNVREYRFTSSALKRELLPLVRFNSDNKLFLATAAAWNSEAVKVPYLWFEQSIHVCPTDFEQLFLQNAPLFDQDEDQSLHKFALQLLYEADLDIDDFEIEVKETDSSHMLQQSAAALYTSVPVKSDRRNRKVRIETIHSYEHNGQPVTCRLSLQEESAGTQYLFLLIPILKRAFETGETLFVDASDSNLHPLLLHYLISLFNSPDLNKAHAQLVLSTHGVSLLSMDSLRRDQIWFVEKDRKTGTSDLYSLDDFSSLKDEDIRKACMIGRFGSIPDLPE